MTDLPALAVGNARDVANEDPWVACVMRSRLDPAVWVPWYGSDKSCFEWAGRLGAVKEHVEEEHAHGRFGDWPGLVWYRRDANTWWYVTDEDARVLREEGPAATPSPALPA